MAGIPIPIRSEYPKETVEVLKSINTILGDTQKYEKVGMEAQTQLQKDLSGTRKKYIDTNVEIQKLLKGNNISNDLAREMQEKNRKELVSGFEKINRSQLIESQKKVLDARLAMGGFLTESQRESVELQKKSLEIQEQGLVRDEEIATLARRGFISRKQEKSLRRRNKITTYLNKFLVKKKWLQTVGKSLKTMAQNAGSGIMQLLKFLFVMALFPGLMDTIVNIFISVATMFIKILAKHLPRIIGALIKIITVVLPRALIRIIDSLFPIIGEMFRGWAKKLEKKYPFFADILNWIGDLFGKNGTLTKFFKSLASLAPVFVGLGIAIKLIMTLTAGLSPVTIVIAGLVIAITYLKSVWDNSAKAMKRHQKETKNLNRVEEEFYKYGVGKFQPKSLGEAWDQGKRELGRKMEIFKKEGMSGLWKEFKNFVKIQWFLWKEIFSKVWDNIKNGVSGLWKKTIGFGWKNIKKFVKFIWKKVKGVGKFLKRLFLNIFSPVISVFKKVVGFFKDLFQPVIKKMGPVFKKIGTILDWIWDGVISRITKVLKSIKKTISNIFNWFGGIGLFGAFDWMTMDQDKKDEYTELTAAMQKEKVDMGDVKAWGKADADERIKMKASGQMSEKEIAMFDALKKQTGGGGLLTPDNVENMLKKVLDAKGTYATRTLIKTHKDYIRRRKKGKK